MIDIPKTLEAVEKEFGDDYHQFRSGSCHDLALALYNANGERGKIVACLRKEIDPDGDFDQTTYSHMIYIDPDGQEWDMDGDNASEKWEQQWPEDPESEDDPVIEFTWEKVNAKDLTHWVVSRHSLMHPEVSEKIVEIAQKFAIEEDKKPVRGMLRP